MQSEAQLLDAQSQNQYMVTIQALQAVLTKRIEIAAHSNLCTCQGV